MSLSIDEIRARLRDKKFNRALIAKETELRYMYLCDLAADRIKDPGASKLDKLRDWFSKNAE